MPYIGLTGIFGAGKSSVLQVFARLGALTIEADRIVRNIIDSEPVLLKKIAAKFGSDVLLPEGRLNRKRLASIVFSDNIKRANLEALLHPYVFRKAESQKKREYKKDAKRIIVFEAPLLIETGYSDSMDKVIVITCPIEKIFSRLEKRGFSRQEVVARFKAQLSQEEKTARADYIIDNSGSVHETDRQIEGVYSEIAGKLL